MFSTVRTLAVILAATAALSGCQASLPTGGLTALKPGSTASAAARGKVRVALAGGLGQAYKTLATRADVNRVHLILTSHASGKSQVREFGLQALAKPMIYVDFDAVAAGKATLAVKAFDAMGNAIGTGESRTAVAGGKTTTVHVKVKLDADAGVGDVDAIITFEDGEPTDPTPRDGEEAFRRADRDGDGWLTLDEYTAAWPHAWGYDRPVASMPMPVPADRSADAAGVAAAPIGDLPMPIAPCYADDPNGTTVAYPCDQPEREIRQAFRHRDANHDGRLSLNEYLGVVAVTECDSRLIDLDVNGDDRLSFDEWVTSQPHVVPMPVGMPYPAEDPAARPMPNWQYAYFTRLDANGNGLLERDEFCGTFAPPPIAAD